MPRVRKQQRYPKRERMPSPNRMIKAGTGFMVGATGLMVGVGALNIVSGTMKSLHP